MRRMVVLVMVCGLARASVAQSGPELEPLGRPDLSGLEPAVAAQLTALSAEAGTARGDAAAWGTLGAAYHAYELLVPAEAAYRNARRLAPTDVRWVHLLGVAAAQRGDLGEARGRFEVATDLDPSAVAAWCRLGQVALELGDLERARSAFAVAAELDPAAAAIAAGLGETALAAGDPAGARIALERALELEPAAGRLHHPLGLAYRALGDLERAAQELTRANAVGVACPDPWFATVGELATGTRVAVLRGRRALAAGRADDAVAAFAAALEQDPDAEGATSGLAAALEAAGRRQAAMSVLAHRLAVRPDDALVGFNLGQLLRAEGRTLEALRLLQQAVARLPDDLEVRLEFAAALADVERLEEAELELAMARLRFPQEPRPVLALADVLARSGKFDRALAVLDEAFQDRADPVVGLSMARLLVTHPDTARRDVVRAEALARGAVGILAEEVVRETLVLVLVVAGKCDEAADHLAILGDAGGAERLRQGGCSVVAWSPSGSGGPSP